MNKQKMLSGIQPTGIFTLGNYIGAVNNWKNNQHKFNCIFFIANLHSLTVKQNPDEFKKFTLNCVALLLACGIDPKQSLIFVQSQVKQHTELTWLLQCCTQFGELSRMTQFKSKSQQHANNINSGLFCYPVLMAADILLYDPDFIPVGIDQQQHVELTKTIAMRFNSFYGETFKIPQAYISEGAKIKSLTNPLVKMSKSDENKKSVVYLLDEPNLILEKFKKATTDSENKIVFDVNKKPGISNLITIYSVLSNLTTQQVEEKFKSTSYGTFKLEVGNLVAKTLKPVREQYLELISKQSYLLQICQEGFEKASQIAQKKMQQINEKMGIF